ncbi:sensor histidine kinase [Natronobacterium texcoconense]|uniref:histidine kinase n=1 Tax=Natronobacterium texcoconense TaxID=1095778 RepID=A0A1H1I3W5_NATTX|nr:ATP-binding protein [Natronobacterium texcoconense]SDR32401.1 PAS domain S-box-containing protein [Natronobacterium texcoconense]
MTSREPEALVPAAVDTLPINFAILDDEGMILHTNRAWQEFGKANEIELRPDTVGTNYLEVTAQAETETARTVADGLAEILDGERELFEHEYPCHSPDEQRWFLMRAAPFTDDGRRYVAVAHFDITERYEYQRRLEQSNEQLEQFAYAVSHDLREPLRMVTSYLQLLEQQYGDELDEDADEFIEFAVDGAERMEKMIEGILTYSRIDTQDNGLGSVDLEAVIDDVLQDLDVRIEETDAEITTESLPTVQGDASQLRQLFQNLLSNAIEYSGEGVPRVTISATREDDEWMVSVSDEGIGIDASDTDRVFEVFQRLHSHEEHEGTGIGLALCKRIVDKHGGDIWLESEPGEGTTISFTLPAVSEGAN